MECNENQTSLATGGSSTRHTEACDDCSAYAADLEKIETLVQQWRMDAPSSALKTRVRQATLAATLNRSAARQQPALMPGGRSGLRLVFASAAVVLAAAVLLAGHSFSQSKASQALADVAAAMTRIENAQVTWYTTDYTTNNDTVPHHFDTLQEVEHQWYLPNLGWRKEGVWGSRLILRGSGSNDSSTYYRYDAVKGKVIAEKEIGGQWTDFSLEGFTGSRYTDEEIIGETHDAIGRPIQEISLSNGWLSGSRSLCWVDENTDLLVRLEEQQAIGFNQWKTDALFLFQYNEPLPRTLFEPSGLKNEGWSASKSAAGLEP